MSKIKLETFKKLLNVKKGGAEIFRFLVKIVVWVLFAGGVASAIYSLNEIRKIETAILNINSYKLQLELNRIERGCKFTAVNEVNASVAKAKKVKKEVKKEDQIKIYKGALAQCLNLNGVNVNTPKIDKKQTSIKKENKK